MASVIRLLFFVVVLLAAYGQKPGSKKPQDEMASFRKVLGALSRQVMLQQLFVEERIRSDGDSGVKQVRVSRHGTRNYFSESHSSANRLLAIHEHANNIRTVGLGEFIGVLNGVEFRTRHNDYRLYMPSKKSKAYHATEEIPFPEVPEMVKNKPIDKQIVEMREWFKAWKNQDHRVRDYRKFFKPVLCYLEGAWGTATKDIDEPFESDRHFIDAKTWFDLQEKIRFTSYTGRKDNQENFSFLPTTITDIVNETIPVFAQWNYRILCHPLKRDVPLNMLRVVDEIHTRLPSRRKYEAQAATRAARFQLNTRKGNGDWFEGAYNQRYTFLDELMSEIPGKDNYPGNLADTAFDLQANSVDPKKPGKLNAAYYHRWFRVLQKGAMGTSIRHRGFADENLFVAMNTQPRVAGMKLETCSKSSGKPRCKTITQKFSYAIPLEIIYLTPLNRWNPFNLEYKGLESKPYGKTVIQGGRNGGTTKQKAYNGINSKKYYQTPSAFFSGKEVSPDAADTTQGSVGVLDRKGQVRITRAAGIRIFFPSIAGVGTCRQRYPIMPVHGEGSAVWKEVGAIKDLLMQSKTYSYMYREPLGGSVGPTSSPGPKPTTLRMQRATKTPPGPHTHEVTLTPEQVKQAQGGKRFTLETTQGAGHTHRIIVVRKGNRWEIAKCDEEDTGKFRCRDKHGKFLSKVTDV